MSNEQLISLGWVHKGHCNCGSRRYEKFELKNDDGKFELKVARTFFLLSKPGYKFHRYKIELLNNKIDEIFQKENENKGNC